MMEKLSKRFSLFGLLLSAAVLMCMQCAQPTSTDDLLGLTFLKAKPTVIVKTPGIITDSTSFAATVSLTLGGQAYAVYDSEVTWKETTGGTLSVLAKGPWINGSREYVLSYTRNLVHPAAATEIFSATLTELPDSWGVSPVTAVRGRNPFSSFSVSAPANAVISSNFAITIAARNADGSVYTGYTGGVNITSTLSSGTLNVTNPVTGFVNGELTLNISYSAPAGALKIRATDVSDSAITGLSGGVRVQNSSAAISTIGFIGWGVANNSNFLQWGSYPGASSYRLSRQLPDSSFQEIGTYGAAVLYAYDTGLSASTEYQYKLEILDAGAVVLETATYKVTTMNTAECTTTIAGGSINTITSFTLTGSPYCITADLTIGTGGQLTVERGSSLRITENVGITVQDGGSLIMADYGSGQTLITTRNTDSPPLMHNGITLAASAAPTVFSPGTENYMNGSVLRHFNHMRAKKPVTSAVDLLIADALFFHNTSPGAGTIAGAVHITGASNAVISDSTLLNNSGDRGAAVLIASVRASIRNSVFQGNRANANQGGAAFLDAPAIFASSNIFTNNYASGNAGGLRVNQSSESAAWVTANFFSKNSSNSGGGGLYLTAQSYILDGNDFQNNTAQSGGGLVAYQLVVSNHATSVIERNRIEGNSASVNAGGIQIKAVGAGGPGYHATTYFRDNLVESNAAGNFGGGFLMDTSLDGFGASARSTTRYVQYNTVRLNSAVFGGGAYVGYSLNCGGNAWQIRGEISYNIFEQNTSSDSGGGVYIKSACTDVSTRFGNRNNFNFNTATTQPDSANIYNAGAIVSLNQNYLEGASDTTCASRSAMKIMSICTPPPDYFSISSPATALYSTCEANPSDIYCVGKR